MSMYMHTGIYKHMYLYMFAFTYTCMNYASKNIQHTFNVHTIAYMSCLWTN